MKNLSKYYTWKNIKSTYKNNKFKILAAIWNDEFDLLNGLYSIPNIQDYFEDIFKKHETLTDDNPPIKYIYILIKSKTHLKLNEDIILNF